MQVTPIYGRKGSGFEEVPIGRVVSKKKYISDRVWKDHFFRMYNGFGISINRLKKDLSGVDELQFNTDKGKFRISMDDFLAYGERSNFADNQLVCNINKMEIVEKHKITREEIKDLKK